METSSTLNPLSALRNRTTRRRFLQQASVVGAAAAAAPLLLSNTAKAAVPTGDLDILNFALNLEYLEAEYYSYAAFGQGLQASDTTGTGTAGVTTVPANPKVNFTNPFIRGYALELANDEIAHVRYLRSVLNANGNYAVSKPNINLVDSFNQAAAAAGLGSSFNPFASQENFLLGSFIFEDVGVTAYSGGAVLIQDPDLIPPLAGILSAEAYHASMIRTTLYGLNYNDSTQFFAQAVNKISDLRDSFDGSTDDDQGITAPDGSANIVPANQYSICFARTAAQVLAIVYYGAGKTNGGFFPGGVNGVIHSS